MKALLLVPIIMIALIASSIYANAQKEAHQADETHCQIIKFYIKNMKDGKVLKEKSIKVLLNDNLILPVIKKIKRSCYGYL